MFSLYLSLYSSKPTYNFDTNLSTFINIAVVFLLCQNYCCCHELFKAFKSIQTKHWFHDRSQMLLIIQRLTNKSTKCAGCDLYLARLSAAISCASSACFLSISALRFSVLIIRWLCASASLIHIIYPFCPEPVSAHLCLQPLSDLLKVYSSLLLRSSLHLDFLFGSVRPCTKCTKDAYASNWSNLFFF